MGLDAYENFSNVCSTIGTPMYDLITSEHNVISGKAGLASTYIAEPNNPVINFEVNQNNYLTDIKINGVSAPSCQATIKLVPNAINLNKDPHVKIFLMNFACGKANFQPYTMSFGGQETSLLCSKYRFNSDFMRIYFSFVNKCKEYSLPTEINLDTGIYTLSNHEQQT